MKKWISVFIIFILFNALHGRVFAVEPAPTITWDTGSTVYLDSTVHIQNNQVNNDNLITSGYIYTYPYSYGYTDPCFLIGNVTRPDFEDKTLAWWLTQGSHVFNSTENGHCVEEFGVGHFVIGRQYTFNFQSLNDPITWWSDYAYPGYWTYGGEHKPAPTPTPQPTATPTPQPTATPTPSPTPAPQYNIPPMDFIQINRDINGIDNPVSNFTDVTAVGQGCYNETPDTKTMSEIIFKIDPAWIVENVVVNTIDLVFKMNPPEQYYTGSQYTSNSLNLRILPYADNAWNDNATWCTKNGINKWVDTDGYTPCHNDYWKPHGQNSQVVGSWKFDPNTYDYVDGIARMRITDPQDILDILANIANGHGFVINSGDANGCNYTTLTNISQGIPFYFELNYTEGGGGIITPPIVRPPTSIDFSGCGINVGCYVQKGFTGLINWIVYTFESIRTWFIALFTPDSQLYEDQINALNNLMITKKPYAYIMGIQQLVEIPIASDSGTLPDFDLPFNAKYIINGTPTTIFHTDIHVDGSQFEPVQPFITFMRGFFIVALWLGFLLYIVSLWRKFF
jgi:hypothetical protein